MDIEELIDLMNSRRGIQLTPLKEKILRSAWKGYTYSDMADQFYYNEAYLKNIATEIWNDLSILSGEIIAKNNLRLKFDHEQPEVLPLEYNRLIDFKATVENDIFEFLNKVPREKVLPILAFDAFCQMDLLSMINEKNFGQFLN